jgi:hypothetical protein
MGIEMKAPGVQKSWATARTSAIHRLAGRLPDLGHIGAVYRDGRQSKA